VGEIPAHPKIKGSVEQNICIKIRTKPTSFSGMLGDIKNVQNKCMRAVSKARARGVAEASASPRRVCSLTAVLGESKHAAVYYTRISRCRLPKVRVAQITANWIQRAP
jgi:hypothetical protein